MLDKARAGDFYILVPDNETRRELDELRIMWGAGDIVEGRPALSRWDKGYKALFEEYVRDGMASVGGSPSRGGRNDYRGIGDGAYGDGGYGNGGTNGGGNGEGSGKARSERSF